MNSFCGCVREDAFAGKRAPTMGRVGERVRDVGAADAAMPNSIIRKCFRHPMMVMRLLDMAAYAFRCRSALAREGSSKRHLSWAMTRR